MTEKVRFGIVGCGRVSRKHLEALTTLENTELVSVCDILPERAKKASEEFGATWHTSIIEMLEKHPEIDVVSILTPSGDHARHSIEAASYGKHVAVEKPMALTPEDAEAMMAACAEHDKRLFVIKQNRYNLPILKLREALEEGRFGKLVMGTVRVRWCRTQEYYDQDEWRGTWSQDGGVLTNQASHHIDMLTWMMGEVDSVFAYTATQLVDIETEDTAAAVLRFSNGAIGIVEATTAVRPKDLEGSITIMGETGTVEIGGFAMNEVKVWNFSDQKESDEELLQFKENPPNVYGFGHQRILEHIAAVIRTGKGGAIDGIEGFKSLLLINAMYESMEIGKEVKLRFRPRQAKLGHSQN